MAFVHFYGISRDLALSETRIVTILDGHPFLPPDEYAFFELFCDEPGCDCRRAIFEVVSRQAMKPVAYIAWGWESFAFYRQWSGAGADPCIARGMRGLSLNELSEQSDLAPALLLLAQKVLLAESAYIERVKRHYNIFRATIEAQSPSLDFDAPLPRGRKSRRKKQES